MKSFSAMLLISFLLGGCGGCISSKLNLGDSEPQRPTLDLTPENGFPASLTNVVVSLPTRLFGVAEKSDSRFFIVRPISDNYGLIIAIPSEVTNSGPGFFQLSTVPSRKVFIVAVGAPLAQESKTEPSNPLPDNRQRLFTESVVLLRGFGKALFASDEQDDIFSIDPGILSNPPANVCGLSIRWKGEISSGDVVNCDLGMVDIGETNKPEKFIRITIERISKPKKENSSSPALALR